MNSLKSMLGEFRQETATTRRVLEQVPADKLAWKPHERSMSLGQLALHIASIPGAIAAITGADTFDVSKNNFNPRAAETMQEVYAALEQSIRDVEQTLTETTEERAQAEWRLMAGERELSRTPREDAWRSLMLNHWYYHRGQLSVYLRLLDIPVPSIYGPSADQNSQS